MKTKNILPIAFGMGLTLLLGGCYSMDLSPADQLSSGNLYQTQEQADEVMMGAYSILRTSNNYGLLASCKDDLSDIAFGRELFGLQPFIMGNYDGRSTYVTQTWQYAYEGSARANDILQNIDRVDMSDELKARYKGEAYFLRALNYFHLLNMFGGVPIYDESVVVSDSYNNMKKPRTTAEETRQFIISDFEKAAAVLPESWDQANYGRATKYAAIALEGEVYLYNKQYQEASNCFAQVINSGLYQLYPDYAGLFKPNEIGGGDNSSEMIFTIQNVSGVGQDYGMMMPYFLGTRSTYGSCWNSSMPTQDFVDSYEYKDGRPFDWEELFPGYTTSDAVKSEVWLSEMTASGQVVKYPDAREKLLQMYDERDPRMQATVILPYTHYLGWYNNAAIDCEFVVGPNVSEANHHLRNNWGSWYTYFWRKFVPEGDYNGMMNNRMHSPVNFPIVRYADVLLMQAECLNELGNIDGAVALVNQVRARVDMPGLNSGPANLEAHTHDQVFNRIRLERAWELPMEGKGFNDLRRWGLLETLDGKVERGLLGNAVLTRSAKSRDYLWPIPENEIEQNPDLQQNPGWGLNTTDQ